MNSQFETGGDGSTANTHDWLTPPEILAKLGAFDLDPCASQFQPWRTAAQQFTITDDGLARAWQGRVWCNPPYGPHAEKFLRRCAEHANGIALIFARTETKAFQQWCFPRATGMLFMAGRIKFRLPGGGACRTCRCSFRPNCLWPSQCRRVAQQRHSRLLRSIDRRAAARRAAIP